MITLPGTGQKVASKQIGDEHVQAFYNEEPLITNIDEVSSAVSYVGKASPGSAAGDSVWQIRKIDTSSGVSVRFAGGSTAFDQKWSDRASLLYS